MAQKRQNREENIVSLEVDDVLISLFLPDRDDYIQKTIIRENNFYERHMLDDIRTRLSGGGIAIDAGAHIGNHTIFLSKVCGMEVIAIEPYRHCFEILKHNVQLNGLQNKVTCLGVAAGAAAGHGDIVVHDPHNLGTVSVDVHKRGTGVEVVTVDSLELDELPALIKIDVEGMEIDVLKGASRILRRHSPLLYVEVTSKLQYDNITDFLRKYGYRPEFIFNYTPTILYIKQPRSKKTLSLDGEIRRAYAYLAIDHMQTQDNLHLRLKEKGELYTRQKSWLANYERTEAELRSRLSEREKEIDAQAKVLETHKKAEAELGKELDAQAKVLETHKKAEAELCNELDAQAKELRQTQMQLAEIEMSTSFQVGRAFVDALVRPYPGILVFPSRLARIALHRKQKRERKLQESLQHVEEQVQQAGRQTGIVEEHGETAPQEDAKITVVMTTYNSADYMSDAIRSILDQSHRKLELIVVDDASTDGTFEMLCEHARVDSRVRPFNCLENRGTYWCKNFGITKATGTYLTFQDSDDVSDPNRFDAQLKELCEDPNAVVATCNYVRRSPSGELTLNRGRFERMAIMAPMFKKDAVIDTVGYFDSVRTSADDEMLYRLRLVFGTDKIRHVDRTLYVASYREGSLTTTSGQVDLSVVEEKAGDLSFLSPDRRRYVYSYREWHKSIKKGDEVPYMAFPLLRRRFPAPDGLLIDSKPAEEYVTVSVASFAAREDSLQQAVTSILPQIDRLNVYLNNYDAVPEFLRHPKIAVARSQEHGDRRDNGKFFFLRNVDAGYHFIIDDDIIYPPNYVQHLILKILQYRKQAVVGIHGVTFADPIERFYKDREVSVFWGGLDVDRVVNLLGSGTVAYHTSTVELDFKDFKVPGMGDLWLAVAAKRQKVPMIAVARAPKWLTSIQQNHTGLYEEFVDNDEEQTEVAVGEGPWDFKSTARNYCSLADHFISNYSAEALRSNEIDVEFWQSFSVREQRWIKNNSQSSAEGRDSSSHSNIADIL